MKRNKLNKLNMTILSMFLVLGLYAPHTFADNGGQTFNLDSFFGHSGLPNYDFEHDGEWPTEEQPGTSDDTAPTIFAEDEDHDSEWPTEEQPGEPVPNAPAINNHKGENLKKC